MSNDILQALNAIEAQLAAFEFDDGQTTQPVGDLLNAIQENIEALRTTYETRSVAETVAQNTNFSDLTTTLEAIRLICCSRLSVNVTGYFIPESAPSSEGTEFTDPPPNFEQPTQTSGSAEYYNRKCKVANALHFSIREWVNELNNQGLDNLTSVSVVVITTLLGAALGEMATPVPILDGAAGAIVGFLASLAIVIFESLSDLNLGILLSALDTNEDDLICALYESNNSTTAKLDYLGVLDNAGVSVANQGLVGAMMVFDVVNNLYFKTDEAIEASLDLYTPPNDCSACAAEPCPDYRIIYGSEVSFSGNQLTIDSQYLSGSNPAGHWLSIHFGQDDLGGTCGPAKDVEIISINQPSTQESPYRMSQTHFLGGSGATHPDWTETDNDWAPHIDVQKTSVRTLTLFKVGTTPYRAVIEIT